MGSRPGEFESQHGATLCLGDLVDGFDGDGCFFKSRELSGDALEELQGGLLMMDMFVDIVHGCECHFFFLTALAND